MKNVSTGSSIPIQIGRKQAAEPEMHIDPVCKMTVAPETAAAEFDHEGTTYYFCMPGCRDKFAADPDRFLGCGAAGCEGRGCGQQGMSEYAAWRWRHGGRGLLDGVAA